MSNPLLNRGLASLPAALRAEVERRWAGFVEKIGPGLASTLCNEHHELIIALPRVWAGSRYVADACLQKPEVFVELVESGDLSAEDASCRYARALQDCVKDAPDETRLMQRMRQFRLREMLRIIWRDLSRTADFVGTSFDLSQLADACVESALDWHYDRLAQRYGRPLGAHSGQVQRMVVLGMGKLGAQELNLSSDIDLIFAFPEAGETNGERSTSNQQFFTHLGQALIRTLDQRTADGFVFRVDMRLRPYGDSGALVLNFDALEEYYQDQGRDWERYAMIKARVCAGDKAQGAQLLELLRPFTFRRYLDYSAIDSLRKMKALINREVQRLDKQDDVKLGAGGIREIEFIVQSFQLIRGGREPELQCSGLLSGLTCLSRLELLPPDVVAVLREAYVFLRNTEHALQAWADEQTQRIPDDDSNRTRLAFAMGFDNFESFNEQLETHRAAVRTHFTELIRGGEDNEAAQANGPRTKWVALWDSALEREQAVATLRDAGFETPDRSLELLCDLRDSRRVQMLQTIGKERLENFLPKWLEGLSGSGAPSLGLERTLPLVEGVLRRSAYLVLLDENPAALEQLLRLCTASSLVAKDLAQNPALLDELLDVRSLYSLPDRTALAEDLRQHMLHCDPGDLDSQMEGLRYFKQAQALRVAACELTGVLPLMKVSDYLTFLAEVIVEHVLIVCRAQLLDRYGRPERDDDLPDDAEFLAVAYGKMGGLEMSHGSDLDLVFLHDAKVGQSTDGLRSIEAQQFFTRLGQRVIHMLSTSTTQGRLYEVDVRLRPSGASGLLVASMESFRNYQLGEAWTWEHQALVRARAVAGSPRLAKQFRAVRREVLCLQRDQAALRQEVISMREKMQQNLLPADAESAGRFHLKQSPGGIVDIEFMVQYAVLAWSSMYPQLTTFTDNIRLLEALGQTGLLSSDDATLLTDAYITYRSAQHKLALDRAPDWVPLAEFDELQAAVQSVWRRMLCSGGNE